MSKGCVPFFIGRVYLWIRKLCTLHTQSAALAYTILESAISNSGLLESAISLTTQIIICTKLVSDVACVKCHIKFDFFEQRCIIYRCLCLLLSMLQQILFYREKCIKICRKRFNYSSYYKYLGKERHKITFCCSVIRVQMFQCKTVFSCLQYDRNKIFIDLKKTRVFITLY